MEWTLVDQSPEQLETEWLCVAGYKIIKVYKHQPSPYTTAAIPTFLDPCLYAGDFNCQRIN